ncbi:MAG: GNAT family protein [Deinococcales bacterium]
MLEKPILTGEKIYLRPITPADAGAMFASLGDEESMYLTGTTQSFTLEQVEAFCERVAHADDRVDYAICRLGDPQYLGEVVLNEIDWDNHSAHFRTAISSNENRNKGYGQEAIKLILDYGFKSLKLHRIELEVYEFNPRALHVYEKLGFVKEGVLRDILYFKERYHNAVKMSLLANEWV